MSHPRVQYPGNPRPDLVKDVGLDSGLDGLNCRRSFPCRRGIHVFIFTPRLFLFSQRPPNGRRTPCTAVPRSNSTKQRRASVGLHAHLQTLGQVAFKQPVRTPDHGTGQLGVLYSSGAYSLDPLPDSVEDIAKKPRFGHARLRIYAPRNAISLGNIPEVLHLIGSHMDKHGILAPALSGYEGGKSSV